MATSEFFLGTSFLADLGSKVHDLDSDTLKVFLTNTAPTNVFAAEVAASADYVEGGKDVSASYSGGVLTGTDVEWEVTEVEGSIGPFRYAGLYNDTAAGKNLICYWDYGDSETLHLDETFTVDFGANILSIAIQAPEA